ncbi:MAG TPA: IS21 family transposase [Gammaproteobacteria bacterium]|nr:IS21 family transposase [Gammaproteobacteria bacterium]
MSHLRKGKTLTVAAAHADMDVKTARKWANRPEFPSECKAVRNWRTRPDPFADLWDGVKDFLANNPGLYAKTLFEYLQREHPGRFTQGHLRTLQRRIKVWRATEGPPQEVFYPQEHHPGELGASDFTHMSSPDIRVGGQAFPHLLYHFVLTYSNWEWASICFSETLEALSEGLQDALFALGGAPKSHRTDRMGVAVINWKRASMERSGTDTELRAEFTQSYEALLRHYGMRPQKTQAGHGNENGDVEQRHYRLKCAIDQALMLRGSRDFETRAEYEAFLRTVLGQLNSGRQKRLKEEAPCLSPLPPARLDAVRKRVVRVGRSSTVYLLLNVYSVPSRLVGEQVEARIGAESIRLFYGQTCVAVLPRLRGRGQHSIDYRHIIHWLVRKPGAFANYRYRSDLFPSSHFRMAYDALLERTPLRADREYLKVLLLAATKGEASVQAAVQQLLQRGELPTAAAVKGAISPPANEPAVPAVLVGPVNLAAYDLLLLSPSGASTWEGAR